MQGDPSEPLIHYFPAISKPSPGSIRYHNIQSALAKGGDLRQPQASSVTDRSESSVENKSAAGADAEKGESDFLMTLAGHHDEEAVRHTM